MADAKKLRVLVVEPNKEPEMREIDDTLEAMQKVVEGCIEGWYPLKADGLVVVCNEEGKLQGLTPNRLVIGPGWRELLVGTFFIAQINGPNWISLDADHERSARVQLERCFRPVGLGAVQTRSPQVTPRY